MNHRVIFAIAIWLHALVWATAAAWGGGYYAAGVVAQAELAMLPGYRSSLDECQRQLVEGIPGAPAARRSRPSSPKPRPTRRTMSAALRPQAPLRDSSGRSAKGKVTKHGKPSQNILAQSR